MAQTVLTGVEVDLRGLIVEDALVKLERYLENAYLAGLPLRPDHPRKRHGQDPGNGSQGTQPFRYVSSWESGMENEGGEGVTVVHFKHD